GSRYICPLNDNTFVGEDRLAYLADILAHPEDWQEVKRQTKPGQGAERMAVVVERQRPQRWVPQDAEPVHWTERLVFVRSVELRAHRLRRLHRRWQELSAELEKLRLPPGPGRHRYTSSKALWKKVDSLLKRTALTQLVDVELTKQPMSRGRSRW